MRNFWEEHTLELLAEPVWSSSENIPEQQEVKEERGGNVPRPVAMKHTPRHPGQTAR